MAAAADLQPVLPQLASQYEHATGVHLVISYGSSATLAQQIQNGAPEDIFLSADYTFAEQIVAANLADSRSPLPYARGTLVLWARKDSPLQPLTNDSLANPQLQKLAIANDMHAPYGRAAVAAIQKLGLGAALKSRLVIAENVGQAAQFADSGNAQAALISLTIASSPHFAESGTFIRIPQVAYPEMRQCAVIMRKAPNRTQAAQFLRWLTSAAVQATLPSFGLAPAE